MSESDSAKNGEMGRSDRGEKPNALESTPNVIREHFIAYFQLRETPLPGGWRFFFAWLGSMFVIEPIDIDTELAKSLSENIHELGIYILSQIVLSGIIMIFVSSIFALVIASSKTRHGPIGLFLFGMMFTAFVVSFANGFSDFWKPPQPLMDPGGSVSGPS